MLDFRMPEGTLNRQSAESLYTIGGWTYVIQPLGSGMRCDYVDHFAARVVEGVATEVISIDASPRHVLSKTDFSRLVDLNFPPRREEGQLVAAPLSSDDIEILWLRAFYEANKAA